MVWSDLQQLSFFYTFRREGVRGFYKGLLPSLLRVTPATALTFVVYENMFHALKSFSDGAKSPTGAEDRTLVKLDESSTPPAQSSPKT